MGYPQLNPSPNLHALPGGRGQEGRGIRTAQTQMDHPQSLALSAPLPLPLPTDPGFLVHVCQSDKSVHHPLLSPKG